MSFPVTCQACGARLKLPPGCTKKKARCPKCDARINLTNALNATAYQPDSVVALAELTPPALTAPTATLAKPTKPSNPPDPTPEARDSQPAAVAVAASAPEEREEDPLPYADLKPITRAATATPTLPNEAAEPPLTLDDDPIPLSEATTPAVVPRPPFRTPAQVNFDSAGLFGGPCEVVLVPHGLFLESVPFRPFLYAPLRSHVNVAGRELALALPDSREVKIEFLGPNAHEIATDTTAFMVGQRKMPELREYRRQPIWLLWIAVMFAGGLAIGPFVMAKAIEFDEQTAYRIAGGFAAVGLLANAAVVLFLRMSIPVKVGVMAGIGLLGTGVFLFGTTAYTEGRRRQIAKERPNLELELPPTPQPSPKLDPIPDKPGLPPRGKLPTAIDAAYREGVFTFEEGPDEVTALGITPDGAVMLVGYRNGTTKVWHFSHLTVDTFTAGPNADGPVTRINFDATGVLCYLTCSGGTVGAFWNDPPEIPVKIPGEPFAVFSFVGEERFAVFRGNGVALRGISPRVFMEPPKGAKGVALLPPAPKDETMLNAPGRPHLLAWHPTGRLLGALPDGSIAGWVATGVRADIICRDHRAPVRVWAASPSTWDFATGDEKGLVGLWANKSLVPKMFTATSMSGVPVAITQLSFSPSGSHLAVADSANTVWVWDLATMRAIVRTTRPNPVRAMCFGPHDDLLLLGDGKSAELWHMTALAKQP